MSFLIDLETLAQRWTRVRTLLQEEGLGSVIVHSTGILGQYGFANYLTGTFPDPKGSYVVFGHDAPPVIIAGSPLDRRRWETYSDCPVEVAYPSDGSRLAQLKRAAEIISTRHNRGPTSVSGGGMRGLPWRDHQALMELLAVPFLPDASHILNRAKRIKTPADLSGIKSSVKMAEEAFDSFIASAHVGITEREGAAMIESSLRAAGAPTCLVNVSAGPYLSQAPTNRALQNGDLATVFVETANAHGYWSELGALVAFGAAGDHQWTLAERTIALCQQAELLLTPGSSTSEIARRIDGLVGAFGQAAFGYGHGVGIDEEGPAISSGDRSLLQTGMTMALHPSILTACGKHSLAVANTYLVDTHRPIPLSDRPYRIRQIK